MREQTTLIKSLVMYAALAFLSLLTVALIMQLWRADIHVPFQYGGDANMTAEWVKSLVDNGWYLDNPYIGMPEGNTLREVPQTENFQYLILKLISLFTRDYAAIMNIFFILTFPLIVCTSFYVFKKFSIPPFLSFIGAFLYAFLPYHYCRGIIHLFLSAYYMIPLAVMVVLWLFSGHLDTIRDPSAARRFFGSINPKFIGSLVICFLFSSSHVYYSYFGCFFLLTAGAVRSFWQKSFKPAKIAAVLIGVIMIGGVINLSSLLLYKFQHGPNTAASVRVYHEAEHYSLKISELLLPTVGHRIPILSDLREKHDREISFLYRFYKIRPGSSIGIIAGAGFMFLLAFLLLYREKPGRAEPEYALFHQLSILNIAAILLSTVGGFNSFVAHIIRYKIRAYERMNIFIAFFSIFVVLKLIQMFYVRYMRDSRSPSFRLRSIAIRPSRAAFYFLLLILLAAGLYDQAGKDSTPDYAAAKKAYLHDEQFVRRMEQALPRDAMVFQLPYVSYPETRFPHKMIDYDHFRCYLHSTALRWSFGVVRGRWGDAWQKEVSSKPAPLFLKGIMEKGFAGLYIDRNGYEDSGEKIVREMRALLNSAPITSGDGTKVFFRLDLPSKT